MPQTGFIGLIAVIKTQHPEMRLGQIIDNLAHEDDLFYLSDDELTKRAGQVVNGGWEVREQWK